MRNELFNAFETIVSLYTEHVGDMLCAKGFALVSASFSQLPDTVTSITPQSIEGQHYTIII